MLNVFLSILPIFLLIVLGYLSKLYVKDVAVFWGFSDKFVYYLFFPALLILDISEADFSGADSFYPVVATIVSTLAIALIIFVGKLFFNTSADLFTSIFQGGVRYNSYVFIALSQSLFGSEGVALSGFFVAYMIILTNIMSVLVMNHYGTGSRLSSPKRRQPGEKRHRMTRLAACSFAAGRYRPSGRLMTNPRSRSPSKPALR